MGIAKTIGLFFAMVSLGSLAAFLILDMYALIVGFQHVPSYSERAQWLIVAFMGAAFLAILFHFVDYRQRCKSSIDN